MFLPKALESILLLVEIIEKENLLENVQKQGEFLLNGLQKLQEKYPNMISNVRGKGLMCAFDLPNGELRKDFQEKLYEENVIILICGDCSLRFRPHLNVTQEDLQFALEKIENIAKNIFI